MLAGSASGQREFWGSARPRPNFPEAEYSQAGIEAQRQMVAEQWRSGITPLYFRAVLDMAVDADASKTNHRLARAAVKRQIRQLVRGS